MGRAKDMLDEDMTFEEYLETILINIDDNKIISNARNHHYVSQFYLRGFSKNGKKEKLFVYNKEQKKYFKSNPRNIASKRDFNRISVKGKKNYFEHHQSKMEGIAYSG